MLREKDLDEVKEKHLKKKKRITSQKSTLNPTSIEINNYFNNW